MELPHIFRKLDHLRRSRDGYFALCPFHPDRDPSLHISFVGGKWLWFCFGCGAGGDERDLARRLGMEREKDADPGAWERVLEQAWAAWETQEALPGRLYLELRQVTEEAQEAFRVGWIRGKGIAFPMRKDPWHLCGVRIRHLEGGTRYTSLQGSQEGAVAPWEVRGAPVLVVVEGTIDALAIFPEVRALGGEVIACKRPEIVGRFALSASRILVWMDEDEAGEQFAQKMIEHLGPRARRVPATGFKDPADLARAASMGRAPAVAEVLRPLIQESRAPAWVALWEALAREGMMEGPPFYVGEDQVRQAQRVLAHLPRELAVERVRQMREQARGKIH